nr:zinc finger, CCHC-type [Tanacetum cinerariifolium]
MAGYTVKDMTTSFEKLDKFEGYEFRRWQKKMHFFLTTLKVIYVLTTLMPELLEDTTMEAIKISAKWENDEYICRGHILNDMSDSLFDVYTNVESAKELWDSLESKYMAEDSSSKKFLTGHFKRDYHSGKKNNANAGGSRKGLRTNPKTKVDEIEWWIDSSATTYVCKDRCWFKTFEPVKEGYVLYMGDEHFAPVHGKGSVALKFSFGKTITLFNVLYVPKLRKNLVSGLVLNNCECKQVYESDKYILSKCGVFVGFGYYNYGIIHETTTLYTPQQNGMAERKNRALKEMVNFMLSYSRTVVRLPDPKRKTLGEKESRDAIFDDKCFSLIPRIKDIIPNVQESQMDDHTDDVPNEIHEPRKAIEDEIGSIMENNSWVLSDLPPGCKPLGFKWIFKRKMKVDVARITTIRLLLALAIVHNLVIHQMNAKTTFLNGDLDEKVYMTQPEGFVMPRNEHKVCKLVKSGRKLKPNTGKPVDQLEYSRDIGCLIYAMISTRPDIAYTVGRLSYSDTSWINHVEDSSSTSGWVFLLGGGAISWAYKKQTCITGSTMESEFVALAAAGKEAEGLRNFIHEIPIWPNQ